MAADAAMVSYSLMLAVLAGSAEVRVSTSTTTDVEMGQKVTIGLSAKSEFDLQAKMTGYVNDQAFMGTCPDCGSQLEFAEGCVKCHVCGFSECG